jgi:hypothetical protein
MPAGVVSIDEAATASAAAAGKPTKKAAVEKSARKAPAKKAAPTKRAAVLAPALGVPESEVLDGTADLAPE